MVYILLIFWIKNGISSFTINVAKPLFVLATAISFLQCLFIPFVHFLLVDLMAKRSPISCLLYTINTFLSFVWFSTSFIVLFNFKL